MGGPIRASKVQVPAFDSSRIRSKAHPFLFRTDDETQAARSRAEESAALKHVYRSLAQQADKALHTELRPLDASWWGAASSKPWNETYPEVFQHTFCDPAAMIAPAAELAQFALLSGDPRSADRARRILRHVAPYSFEFEHYDVGMNYSVWGFRALQVYDLLFDRFAEGQRRELDAFFTRLGRAVLKNDVYWIENQIGGGINNHLAWHKMMLGMLGLFYGDDPLVDYAVDGRRGLVELLELGLVDDGLWCESSLNYHFTAIVPMALMADCLRRVGHKCDLFSLVGANCRTLKQPFDAMFGVLFPDGTVPPIGDAYGQRRPLADVAAYELAWAAWQDPRHAWLLKRASGRDVGALFAPPLPDEVPPPPVATRLYPEHGYAFLRSRCGAAYWDSDAWCAFLTYDRSGVHANQDKLGLMLFGAGRLLIPDVEGRATVPHAFSSRIQRELNRSGLSQNTVMIDGRDQRCVPQLLDLLEFRDLPSEKRVTAADRDGLLYPGVRQQRTVCVTDDYVLDVFQVQCDSPRRIEWITHVLDEQASQQTELAFGAMADPQDGASAWLRDFRSAAGEADWQIEWKAPNVLFRLQMLGEPATELIRCGYPKTDEPDSPRIPMLIVRRRARATTFAAIYTAGRKRLPEACLCQLPERDGQLRYQITVGSRRSVHLIPRLTGFHN